MNIDKQSIKQNNFKIERLEKEIERLTSDNHFWITFAIVELIALLIVAIMSASGIR